MAEMNWLSRRMIDARTEKRAVRFLAKLDGALSFPPQSRLLELGAGGGGLAHLVLQRFSPALYVATDFDPRQLEAARVFLSDAEGRLPSYLELRQADALSLPFPPGSFDAVFAVMMLHHVETQHRVYEKRPVALREVRRVLRPGGLLVYQEFITQGKLRASLLELGFQEVFLRPSWGREVGIYRAPLTT